MENANERLADFLFEVGTLRRINRSHRQNLLVNDDTDNIASHSFRVTWIGWHLAKLEGADPHKVTMMCLLHDLGEARSNDMNWIHKRYVTVHDDEITEEQLGTLPFPELKELVQEYSARQSLEAKVAKDSDNLDQILLLKEYEWQGNQEAARWLRGDEAKDGRHRLDRLYTKAGRALGEAIYAREPSKWWEDLWTNKNRTSTE